MDNLYQLCHGLRMRYYFFEVYSNITDGTEFEFRKEYNDDQYNDRHHHAENKSNVFRVDHSVHTAVLAKGMPREKRRFLFPFSK
jgi:hypothetical protein